jgi:hypothetical protein
VSVGPNQRGRAVRESSVVHCESTPGRWPSLSASRPRADPGPPAPAPPCGVSPALRPGTQGRHGGGAGSNMHTSCTGCTKLLSPLHTSSLFSPQRSQSLHANYMHQISVASSADLARGDPENKCEGCGSSRERAQIRKVLRFCTISSGPTALGPKPEPRSLFPRSPPHSLSLFQSSLSCRVLFSLTMNVIICTKDRYEIYMHTQVHATISLPHR